MTKKEFIQKLRHALRNIPVSHVDEICADYDEHFAMALASGKNEAQTATDLGDPNLVAQSHLATEHLTQAEASTSIGKRSRSLLHILKALAILAPLNFCLLIGPVGFAALIVTIGWSLTLATLATGCGGLVKYLGSMPSIAAPGAAHLSIVCMLGALIGLGILMSMVGMAFTRRCLTLLIRYSRWNINFVINQKEGF